MKKIKLILLFLIISTNLIYAQTPGWEWVVGGTGTGFDDSQSIATDNSGNIYVIGTFASPSITFGNTTLTNTQNMGTGTGDIYLAKFNSQGNVLWANSYGGIAQSSDNGLGIFVENTGNVLITGRFCNSSINIDNHILNSNGFNDMFVAKFDPQGNCIWAKNEGGSGSESGIRISSDANGYIYVLGNFDSNSFTIGSTTLNKLTTGGPQNSTTDMFLVKYDSLGNVLWAKSAGGLAGDSPSDLIIDNASNIIITGSFNSTTIYFGTTSLVNPYPGSASISYSDIFIAKYNSNGVLQWARSAGSNMGDRGNSITVDNNNNLYLTGYYFGNSITFGNYTLSNSNAGYSNFFIAKYDAGGIPVWAKRSSGNLNELGISISIYNSSNLILFGTYENSTIILGATTLNSNSPTKADIFITELDTTGNFIWAKSAGGSLGDYAQETTSDNNGNVYITGFYLSQTMSFDSSMINSQGTANVFVAKIGNSNFNQSPISTFNSSDTSFCSGTCVNFTNQSSRDSSWLWLFPGGTPASSTLQTPPQVCYNTPGTYSVTLITSNAFGSDTLTLNNYITVDPSPVAQVNSNITTCEGSVINLTSSGGTSYSWSGPNGFTSGLQNPIIPNSTTANSGTYSVVVANSLVCTDTASTQITINAVTPAVANSNSPLCAGQILNLTANTASSYSWSGPNGFTSSLQNPSITNLSNNNSGTYTLIVANGNGCADTTTLSISVLANNLVTVNSNGPLCAGQTLNLNASNGASYVWTGPNGFTSTFQNPTINNVTTTNAGSYSVVVTNSNGCTNSSSLTVSINPNTPVTVSSNSPICEGDNLSMNASAGSSYSWTGPNGFTSTIQNPTISNITTSSSGLYSVTVTNACGTGSSNTQVQVGQKPTAAIAVTQTVICEGDTVYLTANGGNSYYWYGPNSFNSILSNPTVNNFSGANAGAYYLVATNTDNCSDTTVVNLALNETTCFFIPSVFTPNNDGTNDTWVIEGLWQFPNCVVKVYNRWGQPLFESKGYASPWDGTFEGNECPIADYYYIIDLKNGSKVFTGTVTIKR